MKKVLLVATVFGALGSAPLASAQTILLDMKGPGAGNPFWAAVEAGAKEKAKALGVTLVVLAPPQETDVQAQIAQVEDQLAKGIDALALAPTDPNALAPLVDSAKAKKIPVVFVDTNGSNPGVTFIGTNNETGARLAAEHICQTVPKGSEVAILQGIVTTSTGKARAEGAKSGLAACGLKVVAEQPADWDRAKGQTVMENILTGNPNIAAVFASNDNMALGAMEAIKAANKKGKILVVGFDANPDAAASILAGEMNASVAQSPKNMGALAVENLVKLKKGETIPPVVDTGTQIVTKENATQFK
jgi:ABC-type sugar transport system substrate-binding protein